LTDPKSDRSIRLKIKCINHYLVHIRQATLKDAHALAVLSRRTFQDTYAADNDPTDMALYTAQAFSLSQIQTDLSTAAITVWLIHQTADSRSPLVGYALLKAHASLPCIPGNTPIELVRLYIDCAAIGQGYGSKLMQTCLTDAAQNGFDTLWLGVWEKNYRAQKFYARWKFRPVGTHIFQLGNDRQTDFVLIRSIDRQ